MDKKKVLIFGSNGLVGKSLNRVLAKSQKISEIVPSTRNDTNLFSFDETKKTIEKIKPKINNEKKEKISEKQNTKTKTKNTANIGSKFFSYLVVLIISFVALIILLDTLKNPLINVFPGLEILLFNLFETLQDINLFIIDLI